MRNKKINKKNVPEHKHNYKLVMIDNKPAKRCGCGDWFHLPVAEIEPDARGFFPITPALAKLFGLKSDD